jgi:hypothetical protein
MVIEQLDGVHPGLKAEVDAMLAHKCLQREIQTMIRERYGVSIPLKTLSNYKQKRWLPSALRVARYAEITKGIIKGLGKGDPDKLTFKEFLTLVIDASRDRPRLLPRTAPNPIRR